MAQIASMGRARRRGSRACGAGRMRTAAPSPRTRSALADDEFDSLATACELHTSAARHDDPSLAACFVADRLDLSRVGFRPDPRRMPPAPQLLDRAFIEAAIERERLGLGWPGGAEIGAVWGVTPRS